MTLLVQRSVVHGRVDEVKTEYSRDRVPLDEKLAELLLEWKKKVFSKLRAIGFFSIQRLESLTTKRKSKSGT